MGASVSQPSASRAKLSLNPLDLRRASGSHPWCRNHRALLLSLLLGLRFHDRAPRIPSSSGVLEIRGSSMSTTFGYMHLAQGETNARSGCSTWRGRLTQRRQTSGGRSEASCGNLAAAELRRGSETPRVDSENRVETPGIEPSTERAASRSSCPENRPFASKKLGPSSHWIPRRSGPFRRVGRRFGARSNQHEVALRLRPRNVPPGFRQLMCQLDRAGSYFAVCLGSNRSVSHQPRTSSQPLQEPRLDVLPQRAIYNCALMASDAGTFAPLLKTTPA